MFEKLLTNPFFSAKIKLCESATRIFRNNQAAYS